MLKNFCFIIFVFFFLGSCIKEQTSPTFPVALPANCDTNTVYYLPTVKQIIAKNCAYSGCHFPGNGNYDFISYEVVADRIRSGRFTERISLPVNSPLHMPPFIEMNACEKAKLLIWINGGFPEN